VETHVPPLRFLLMVHLALIRWFPGSIYFLSGNSHPSDGYLPSTGVHHIGSERLNRPLTDRYSYSKRITNLIQKPSPAVKAQGADPHSRSNSAVFRNILGQPIAHPGPSVPWTAEGLGVTLEHSDSQALYRFLGGATAALAEAESRQSPLVETTFPSHAGGRNRISGPILKNGGFGSTDNQFHTSRKSAADIERARKEAEFASQVEERRRELEREQINAARTFSPPFNHTGISNKFKVVPANVVQNPERPFREPDTPESQDYPVTANTYFDNGENDMTRYTYCQEDFGLAPASCPPQSAISEEGSSRVQTLMLLNEIEYDHSSLIDSLLCGQTDTAHATGRQLSPSSAITRRSPSAIIPNRISPRADAYPESPILPGPEDNSMTGKTSSSTILNFPNPRTSTTNPFIRNTPSYLSSQNSASVHQTSETHEECNGKSPPGTATIPIFLETHRISEKLRSSVLEGSLTPINLEPGGTTDGYQTSKAWITRMTSVKKTDKVPTIVDITRNNIITKSGPTDVIGPMSIELSTAGFNWPFGGPNSRSSVDLDSTALGSDGTISSAFPVIGNNTNNFTPNSAASSSDASSSAVSHLPGSVYVYDDGRCSSEGVRYSPDGSQYSTDNSQYSSYVNDKEARAQEFPNASENDYDAIYCYLENAMDHETINEKANHIEEVEFIMSKGPELGDTIPTFYASRDPTEYGGKRKKPPVPLGMLPLRPKHIQSLKKQEDSSLRIPSTQPPPLQPRQRMQTLSPLPPPSLPLPKHARHSQEYSRRKCYRDSSISCFRVIPEAPAIKARLTMLLKPGNQDLLPEYFSELNSAPQNLRATIHEKKRYSTASNCDNLLIRQLEEEVSQQENQWHGARKTLIIRDSLMSSFGSEIFEVDSRRATIYEADSGQNSVYGVESRQNSMYGADTRYTCMEFSEGLNSLLNSAEIRESDVEDEVQNDGNDNGFPIFELFARKQSNQILETSPGENASRVVDSDQAGVELTTVVAGHSASKVALWKPPPPIKKTASPIEGKNRAQLWGGTTRSKMQITDFTQQTAAALDLRSRRQFDHLLTEMDMCRELWTEPEPILQMEGSLLWQNPHTSSGPNSVIIRRPRRVSLISKRVTFVEEIVTSQLLSVFFPK
jgi:hypothetical protein